MSRSQGPIIIYTWFSHGGKGGTEGRSAVAYLQLTSKKGKEGGGSLEYCRTLEGDQVNIIMVQSKSMLTSL